MNWSSRLEKCEDLTELISEKHSICWSYILNRNCLRDICEQCPVELVYEERKKIILGTTRC